MRCTKCSFISFDDLSACAKCSNDLLHLSKELNGTCVEARQEFFLGTAIQAGSLSEGDFSDSLALPPIDHSSVNFDDTNTSRFPSLAASTGDVSGLGFDDSLSFAAEDDVSIELGDIMPLDFDQLDSLSISSDSSLETTDALDIDNISFGMDKASSLVDSTNSEIDFDLTEAFDDSGSNFKFNDDFNIDNSPFAHGDDSANATTSLFEKTFADLPAEPYGGSDMELDRELFQQFSDRGGLDETISLNVDSGLELAGVSHVLTGDDSPAPLELDESLVAELAGASSLDASGEFSVDFSTDHTASGEFVLDEALVAELASDENVTNYKSSHQLEFADTLVVGQSNSFGAVENFTGDFPPINEDDEVELSGLDLADIDVSDLVDTSGGVYVADVPQVRAPNDTLQEADAAAAVSLSGGGEGLLDDLLLEDLAAEPGEVDGLSLAVDAMGFDDELESYLLNESVAQKNPLLELIGHDEDDDDVPPDLPA